MLVIPVQKNLPSVTQGQTLDGVDYVFHFTWNMRGGWYIGLDDSNGDPIFQARKVVIAVNFLDGVRYDARCPPGDLVALDVSGRDLDPSYLDLVAGSSYDDLQGRVLIAYIPFGESA